MIQIEVPEDWDILPGTQLRVQLHWQECDARSTQMVEVEEVKATRHECKISTSGERDIKTEHYIKKQLTCRRIGSPVNEDPM